MFDRFLSRLGALTAMALGMLVLAACTVVVDEGPPPRPDFPRPGICTREFAPVCARRGPDRQTFSNACMAESAGYRIVHGGRCRSAGPGPGPDRPRFCTQQYAPVCARRGRHVRTFGNSCEARAADYDILHRGQCR